MKFFDELKRRNVFRVAGVYAVVAWLLVQVVVAVETPLALPAWTDTLVIVLFAVGFPVAMIVVDRLAPAPFVTPPAAAPQGEGGNSLHPVERRVKLARGTLTRHCFAMPISPSGRGEDRAGSALSFLLPLGEGGAQRRLRGLWLKFTHRTLTRNRCAIPTSPSGRGGDRAGSEAA